MVGEGSAPNASRRYSNSRTTLLSRNVIAGALTPSHAQDYPTRAVEMIVPFAAGGGSEVLARLVGDGLAKRLGQPFVVLNRPGANTNLGTLAAGARSPTAIRC